jgi:hypothetical protein
MVPLYKAMQDDSDKGANHGEKKQNPYRTGADDFDLAEESVLTGCFPRLELSPPV